MSKHSLALVAFLSIAVVFALGCGTGKQEAEPETSATEQPAETALSDFEQMRDEYVGTAQTALTDWGHKIADLEARKATLPAEAQKPLEEPLSMLKEKRDSLGVLVQRLAMADQPMFDSAKAATEAAFTDMNETYNEVMARF